ncbi:MAG TPA: amidohydrolase family protein, partial [Vicinamibacterales bacterium]
MNRREFLKNGTAIAALLGGRATGLRADGSRPLQAGAPIPGRGNLAIVNARMLTVDVSRPTAQAVLVRNGRIAHVGTTDEVRARAADAEVFDVQGRTVVPGFIDAHTHIEVALSHEMYAADVHAPPLKSIREIQNVLAAKAAATPSGQWVIGRAGFNLEDSLPEKRLPNRQDLDEVSQDHPVIIFSGRHISMLNTRALKEMGMWDAASAKPPTGTTIHRDASGV